MYPKRTPGMPPKKRTGPTFLATRLEALGFADYQKYLAGKHWQDTRERFYADPHTPKACLCGETEGLHLHHTTYFRLGSELLEDLHPLCPPCHMDVHVLARRGLMDLKLQGYCSDLRRTRYARERAELLKRTGTTPEDWPDESHDPVVWAFNATKRWDQDRRDANPQTPRENARHLRKQIQTGHQYARPHRNH